jgi:hypothetical protein
MRCAAKILLCYSCTRLAIWHRGMDNDELGSKHIMGSRDFFSENAQRIYKIRSSR